MPLRLALVGYGAIARNRHLPALATTPDVELVAVASPGGTPPGLPGYASLQALLASGPEVDAVALCTPPQGRAALAAEALGAGKHVLLEKPPGAVLSEWPPLAALAREKGLTLFATWHSRFAPVEGLRASIAAMASSPAIPWRSPMPTSRCTSRWRGPRAIPSWP